MEVKINYREKRGGRSSAFIDGKKLSVKKAQQLVSGKKHTKITSQNNITTIVYIITPPPNINEQNLKDGMDGN